MRIPPLLIFLLLVSCSYGQVDYFSGNPEWNQAIACNSDGCVEYQDFVYYINGDSTLNSQSYKKFYKRGQSAMTDGPTGPECGPFTTFNDLAYLVRQDGYQVYLWNGISDTLLYDFDVAVGDTFPISYNVCDRYIVVDSIEQIVFGGQLRNKFFFTETNTGSFSNMIEGVGWPVGFFEPTCAQPNCGYQFNCYSLNGQILLGTNCFFEASFEQQSGKELVKISPNPCSDFIEFTVPKGQKVTRLEITDAEGVLIKAFIYKSFKGSKKINLDDFSPGIYYFSFVFENDQSYTLKVIKI